MRKPAYLAVMGISIVVAAVSLGVALTRYLGLRAYSPMAPPAAAAAAPSGKTAAIPPPEQWNNLFAPGDGMKMASRLPAANAKSGSQAPRTAFVLVGTIVSSTPSARRAILWADGMKFPKAFREKEEVEPGALLSSVERDKVWIARGKEREKLVLLPVGSRARPTAAAAPTAAPSVSAPYTAAPSVGTPSVSAPYTAAPSVGAPYVGAPSVGRYPVAASPPTVSPSASSGGEEEEGLNPQERRRRIRGGRR